MGGSAKTGFQRPTRKQTMAEGAASAEAIDHLHLDESDVDAVVGGERRDPFRTPLDDRLLETQGQHPLGHLLWSAFSHRHRTLLEVA